jgi:hypothetical protein
MKLLHCTACLDVFNLPNNGNERSCSCGLTKGRYLDGRNAVYSGEHAVPMGFSNEEFKIAVNSRNYKPRWFTDFGAFTIPDDSITFKREEK